MDEHFLDKLMHELDPNAKKGSHTGQEVPWYNVYGDCIQFQTANVAVVAERIDYYLTIYRSAENNQPIGFQIKDVLRLIQKYGSTGIDIWREVEREKLIHVSWLLLNAFRSDQPTINRLRGYESAIGVLSMGRDVVREHIAVT